LWSSQVGRAEALAREMLARPHDPVLGATVRNGLARALVWQGRPADSLAEIELALEGPDQGPSDRAYLLAEAALRLLHCRDLEASERAAEEALALAREVRHPIAECDAVSARCWTAVLAGRVPHALEFGARAVELAE